MSKNNSILYDIFVDADPSTYFSMCFETYSGNLLMKSKKRLESTSSSHDACKQAITEPPGIGRSIGRSISADGRWTWRVRTIPGLRPVHAILQSRRGGRGWQGPYGFALRVCFFSGLRTETSGVTSIYLVMRPSCLWTDSICL